MQEKFNDNKRNSTVDILRGIAMLMVVFQHTMSSCTENSQQSFLFNVVWSLQMPLFILISGYVTRYTRDVATMKELGSLIKKCTVSYLLPWVVWTFIIRGLIFGQTGYLNIGWLLWHMDSGYWFLFTIWTIRMVFGIAKFLCRTVVKSENASKIKAIILTGVFYVIGMVVLAGIGLVAGMTFLCIKLTLYYMPFFFAGYIYGKLQDDIFKLRKGKQVGDCAIAVTLVIWLSVVTRVSLYELADSGLGIILRAGTSLCGCVTVCGLCAELFSNVKKIRGGGIPLVWNPLTGDIHSPLSAFMHDADEYQADISQLGRHRIDGFELHSNHVTCSCVRSTIECECNYTKGCVWKVGKLFEWCGIHSLKYLFETRLVIESN